MANFVASATVHARFARFATYTRCVHKLFASDKRDDDNNNNNNIIRRDVCCCGGGDFHCSVRQALSGRPAMISEIRFTRGFTTAHAISQYHHRGGVCTRVSAAKRTYIIIIMRYGRENYGSLSAGPIVAHDVFELKSRF